ncbi:HlyD family type I secretion periplasmic adaptor subunit [Massilia sp. SYSU DXS3249]
MKKTRTKAASSALDFSPPLLRLQQSAPNPLGRKVLWALLILLVLLALWAVVGKLDIVAVAEGKLVPQSYVKIVQPAESGIVKEILVKEGDSVRAGQVLMRMDTLITDADAKSIQTDRQGKLLALRRVDAELADTPFQPQAGDPPHLLAAAQSQYRANRAAFQAALAEEKSRLAKARQDLAAALEIQRKFSAVLPHYREQEKAFEKLGKDGFAGGVLVSDKRRERIEKEQELATQDHMIESARAGVQQSEMKLVQIDSDYRRQLHVERGEAQRAFDQLSQELAKQTHRKELLELKATQDSVVKELATHSIGTVVQPGTVLLTLVPRDETLRAEVWLTNDDIGFVKQGQTVRLKFAAFPFQKYGMVEGTVEHIGADSVESAENGARPAKHGAAPPSNFKALVALKTAALEADGARFPLSAGMQANAEILLGTRTVLEYLLSPMQKAWHEAARER